MLWSRAAPPAVDHLSHPPIIACLLSCQVFMPLHRRHAWNDAQSFASMQDPTAQPRDRLLVVRNSSFGRLGLSYAQLDKPQSNQ